MNLTVSFFITGVMLGVGLAMDAFSVSLANGLNEPLMKKSKSVIIAGTFAFFQFAMPMIGWVCVHTIVVYFSAFEKAIPYIALVLLTAIGIKMIVDGARYGKKETEPPKVGVAALLLQGVATSIDALSVGFTIEQYGVIMALVCALIIAVVTFGLCILGIFLGKKFGTKFAGKASIVGGIILIAIGLEIFLTGIL